MVENGVQDDTAINDSSNSCLIEAFYNKQYDRLAKHEDQSLTFSNLIVTLTLASFAMGAMTPGNVTMWSGVILPFAVILFNICAILFIKRSHSSSVIHVKKAKACLFAYAPEVLEINAAHPWPTPDPWYKKRHMIIMILHGLLLAICLISIASFLHGWSGENQDPNMDKTTTNIFIEYF